MIRSKLYASTQLRSVFIVLAVALTCAFFVRSADAQTSRISKPANGSSPLTVSPSCYASPITQVYMPTTGGSFDVRVAVGKFTHIRFPRTVTLRNAIFFQGGFHVDQKAQAVTITPGAGQVSGDTGNVVVKGDKVNISVDVTIVDASESAAMVDVVLLPVVGFKLHKARAQREHARLARQRSVKLMRDFRRQKARALLGLKVLRPSSPRMTARGARNARYAPDGEARAVLTRILELDGDRYLEVILDNRMRHGIELESVWISEGMEQGVPVDFVGETGRAPNDDALLRIPVGDVVRGMVVVPPGVTANLDSLRVTFRAPPGLTDVVAQQVVELWPKMPEHLARKRRWAKQATISVRGGFGGFWTNDAAGQDRTAGASQTGLSVRISKGMHHNFAFEGEVAGGRSGEVNFSDIDWQGMQGDVTRSASFGRFLSAGVIRFGSHYVLSTRVGIGVQGTSYSSLFTTRDNASMEGPGNSFLFDGLVSFGIGLDARLGEHWTLGAGANFLSTWRTATSTLDAGLQLGYRWSP